MATQTYDARASGAGLFAVRLAEALVAAGHELLVVAPSDRGTAYRTARHGVRLEFARAFPLRPFSSKVRLALRARARVETLFEKFAPEVVHVQDHYPLGRVALDVACHNRVPVLATNHFLPENLIPYLPVPRQMRPAVSRLLWSWVTRTYDRADLVTTPSQVGVAALRAAGLRPPALAVSSGVDWEFFRPLPELDRASVRRGVHLDPDAITLLFAGRLDREKRLDVLLAALASFDRAGDPSLGRRPALPSQLIVVGAGLEEARWRRLAKRLGLERRVVFTGFVSRQRLLELLNSADIFAMPSEAELLSIATLEAMAVGLPILAADARALPELVEPGVNGELFRPGDASDAARRLRHLCEHRADWPRLAEASRRRAQEHDFARVVARYEALYRDLASRLRCTGVDRLRGNIRAWRRRTSPMAVSVETQQGEVREPGFAGSKRTPALVESATPGGRPADHQPAHEPFIEPAAPGAGPGNKLEADPPREGGHEGGSRVSHRTPVRWLTNRPGCQSLEVQTRFVQAAGLPRWLGKVGGPVVLQVQESDRVPGPHAGSIGEIDPGSAVAGELDAEHTLMSDWPNVPAAPVGFLPEAQDGVEKNRRGRSAMAPTDRPADPYHRSPQAEHCCGRHQQSPHMAHRRDELIAVARAPGSS